MLIEILWRMTPWRWLHKGGLRKRFAAWVYGTHWGNAERKAGRLWPQG